MNEHSLIFFPEMVGQCSYVHTHFQIERVLAAPTEKRQCAHSEHFAAAEFVADLVFESCCIHDGEIWYVDVCTWNGN